MNDRISEVNLPKSKELTKPIVTIVDSEIALNIVEYTAIYLSGIIDAVYRES